MLTSLHVKNLALIRDTELSFGEGLNVLSGETGAGKSILLGSILLCLGVRSDKELIRTGAESAYVELVFSGVGPEITEKLKEMDVYPEDGEYRFSRRLTEKKSVAKINGETVSLGTVRSAASLLIDLYAQNEQRTLLDEENYVDILDAFGGEELEKPKADYRAAYRAYRTKKEEIRKLGSDDEERRRTLDFLAFELDEIGKAKLRPGEEEELKQAYERYSHEAAIREGLAEASAVLSDETSEKTARVIRLLQDVEKYDPSLSEPVALFKDVESLLDDGIQALKSRLIALGEENEKLPAIEERMDEIGRLKLKYGASVEEILKTGEKLEKEFAELRELDARSEELKEELERAKEKLVSAAKSLREARIRTGERFSSSLVETMKGLNFTDVRFSVEVTETNRYTTDGADEVRFLISVNPGEPVKPLYKVASGGELSRIMLAVKTITVRRANRGEKTLVFDEVDTGISGLTASLVGERLYEISSCDQVILISHLPQIVSLADRHFKIEKYVENGETVTTAGVLSGEESVYEVARLLGTGEVTEANLRNAREMKDRKGGKRA